MWHELPLLLEFASRTVLFYSLWQLRSVTKQCCSFSSFRYCTCCLPVRFSCLHMLATRAVFSTSLSLAIHL